MIMCQSACLQICGRQAVQIATLATTMYGVVWFRGFCVVICDLDHLHERLETCWLDFPKGEIDAAIDIVRPRLEKLLDWEGKV